MTDDKRINFSKEEKKIGGCPAESSFCAPNIEVSPNYYDRMVFNKDKLSVLNSVGSISLSKFKSVYLAEITFEPIDLSNIPNSKLIKHIFNKSILALYYFCWRYSFEDDGEILEIRLDNYRRVGYVHYMTESLSTINIEGRNYELMEALAPFQGARNFNLIPLHTHNITRTGVEIYKKLKEYGFVRKLIEFVNNNLSCLTPEHEFEARFQEHFFFKKTKDDVDKDIALNNLKEEFNNELPEKRTIIWEKSKRSYLKVGDYVFEDNENNEKQFIHLETIFYCDHCTGVTKFNLNKQNLKEQLSSGLASDFCDYCKHPFNLFLLKKRFTELYQMDWNKYFEDKPFITKEELKKISLEVSKRSVEKPKLKSINEKEVLTCLKFHLKSKKVELFRLVKSLNESCPNAIDYENEVKNWPIKSERIQFRNTFTNFIKKKVDNLIRRNLVEKNYDTEVIRITKEGKKHIQ